MIKVTHSAEDTVVTGQRPIITYSGEARVYRITGKKYIRQYKPSLTLVYSF